MENVIDTSKIEGCISIFWTGGWDSTYRVVELSRQKVSIQPVYIYDDTRKSNERELASISKITQMLKQRQETLAEFLPIKIINVAEIPENKEVSGYVDMLRKKYGWGIQHDWTARVALMYPMIEMCIEKVIRGYMPTRKMIEDLGKLVMSSHGWVVDRESSDEALIAALGNITLPIFETTELEMLENIRAWGYEDVMANIWFCHQPINGETCGLCSPCHTKYDSDMGFMLTEKAKKHCRNINLIEKYVGKYLGKNVGDFAVKVYRKLCRILCSK